MKIGPARIYPGLLPDAQRGWSHRQVYQCSSECPRAYILDGHTGSSPELLLYTFAYLGS